MNQDKGQSRPFRVIPIPKASISAKAEADDDEQGYDESLIKVIAEQTAERISGGASQ